MIPALASSDLCKSTEAYMTEENLGHHWSNYRFDQSSSGPPAVVQQTSSISDDDDSNAFCPMEKRQGYFDLSLSDQTKRDPASKPPKIFTIDPNVSSNEETDKEEDNDKDSDTIDRLHDKMPERGVSFRPKLEYIGRAYSAAQSLATTNDDEPRTKKERVLDFLHRKFPSRIVRRVLKCTIAYLIAALFSLIRPVAQALGPSVFLTTAGMLFSHPGRSMGAQFDATITSVLGICSGMAFTYAGLAAAVSYNTRHPDNLDLGVAINAAFLFCGIFLAQMLRQVYPRFFFFSLQAMILMIFSFTSSGGLKQTTLPTQLPLQLGIPLLCGAAISQVVNLLFWPETAVDGLGRALKETFTSSKEMLDMITKQFFLDPESEMVAGEVVDITADRMRAGITKVKTAYHEAKYEISYTYIRPYELGEIQKSLDRLTKHLNILGGSLKTERVLFENAIAALELETEQNADNPPVAQQQHPTEVDSDQEGQPRKSVLRWIDSEDEKHLRRAALFAAGEYSQTGKYTSPHNSRPSSRAGSRAGSRRTSFDEDYAEQNQKSVTSIKSFLNMARLSGSTPKPPPKTNRQLEHGDGELLVTYLESLRDPLMRLSIECAAVLDCVNRSVIVELDVDDEDDKSIRKTWVAYISHLLKWQKGKPFNGLVNTKAHRRHEPDECNCAQTIHEAIIKFDKAEQERMHTLYELNRSKLGSDTLDLGKREELFLVFFFIFSLREVANELESMARNMDNLRASRRGRKRKHLYMPQLTQKWWKKWAISNNHQSIRDKGGYALSNLESAMPTETRKPDVDEEYRLTKMKTGETVRRPRRLSSVASHKSSSQIALDRTPSKASKTSKASTTLRKRRTIEDSIFSQPVSPLPREVTNQESAEDVEAQNEAEDTPKLPLFLRIRYNIWLSLQYFKKYEFKFALKMATAVLVLSLPAFFPSSAAWYQSARGQWACMTIIAIMNPTSGGTWEASFWRVVGTLVGAFVGWAALEANGGSPYLLAVFAVLLSMPFFYIHLGSTYSKVGIVVLMTYMAVALSRYVNEPDEPIAYTVWKRTATVVIGILVAVSLNWMIWPFVARHAVRKSVAGIIGELGDYYAYLMGTFLFHDPQIPPKLDDIKSAQKMEGKIQKSINACAVLLELTDHEPRLKGPFPKAFYSEMIVSTRNLLDRMLSIRIALSKMPTSVKKNICMREYNIHRRDMTASMLLHFYTLQTSLRSKIPLPAYMPSARAARTRLVRYRGMQTNRAEQWARYKNLCWFAMASCTEEIIEELEHLNDLVRFVVGENRFADKARRLDNLL